MTERKGQVFERKPRGGESEPECRSAGSSTVVVYGDPQLVADAFALALDAVDRSTVLLTAGAVAAEHKESDS